MWFWDTTRLKHVNNFIKYKVTLTSLKHRNGESYELLVSNDKITDTCPYHHYYQIWFASCFRPGLYKHGILPHASPSVLLPWHGYPPRLGGGLSHCLFLILKPLVPHVDEHSSQLDHSLHAPSTVLSHGEKKINKISKTHTQTSTTRVCIYGWVFR